MEFELESIRLLFERNLTKERIDELIPDYPKHMPTILSQLQHLPVDSEMQENIDDLKMEYRPRKNGNIKQKDITANLFLSNAWVRSYSLLLNVKVISGNYTSSGKPILASDISVGDFSSDLWYNMHIHVPGRMNAIGTTIAGCPGIFIGKNEHIAWGLSNSLADTQV